MKVLILGATGDVGREAVREALLRGHQVTACARKIGDEGGQPNLKQVQLDVLAEPQKLEELFRAHDAVISTLRPPSGQESVLVTLTGQVLSASKASGTPVYITGGAATLRLGDGSDHTVVSAPDFLPQSVRPIAEACVAQDALLVSEKSAHWTCLRPSAMLLPEVRTGRYALGRDELVRQEDGQSRISFADFAVAMLDLVGLRPAPHQRLTAGW
ncbi:potassium transporter TrkA [Sedimentitalea sp. CY04]|uniref:Potassium transporter TrkA n=1 Tax=Parasedimentitalea denitrificans TaxID=2211118 RepID=A0ABX0W4R9_9RHOB|nr:NAD(P)H-binding protein [Sedimentitalea sp. CY04]NIZ60554.1 potassium transporter TrkA [Sedimentitalea sp. CY04]